MNGINFDTKIGQINIFEIDGKLTNLTIGENISDFEFNLIETEILTETKKQLLEYLDKKRETFSIPLNPKGTDFFKIVWEEVCKIPFGETRTYKDIAVLSKSPKAYRAVGMANNKNPIPIIIPCHRVIGTSGKLIGYAYGLDFKENLLNFESNTKAERSFN